jgi:hypothetical protein
MKKYREKITNPMTIIAIFAGLTEASATVSLPFLDDSDRDIYVWFLISFPLCLIFLFFVTLNFNYKSLYAPSDFEKAEDFIKIIDDATHPKDLKAPPSNGTPPDQHSCTAGNEEDVHPPARLHKCLPQDLMFRQQKSRYSSRHAQDPPAHINLFNNHAMQPAVHLPQMLHGLHLIDTRRINTKEDIDALIMEIGQRIRDRPDSGDLIIFLTNQKSAQLIIQYEFERLNKHQTKQPFYMVYNLRTYALTQGRQVNDRQPHKKQREFAE